MEELLVIAAIIFYVTIVVFVLRILWRAMRAHESIAESLQIIAMKFGR